MSFKITGTGKGIPKKVVSNDDLSAFLDTDDEWITTRTGIKTRRVCTDESLAELSQTAAQSAMKKAGLKPGDIDLIICSTINGDYVTPSLACVVQRRIGALCPAFDVNAACSGFIYALDIAALYLEQNKAQNILIVCAEMMSRHVDWTDRRTCVLFGDGAGACVVSKGTALKYIKLVAEGDDKPIYLESGSGNSPFSEKKKQGFMHMLGNDVYKFAVGMVEREVKAALAALDMTPGDIDYFVLHQANKRIIDTARTKLKQPAEKFPLNIQDYGNISSATIPILLDEMTEQGRIKTGDTLFLNAFGAGMTAGSCVLVWE
jgi:3-oxoacyl-(acyl-carrier-protein) synthase III